jgi:hypothetical protein
VPPLWSLTHLHRGDRRERGAALISPGLYVLGGFP